MIIVKDKVCGVNSVSENRPVALFAAEELQKYIELATGGRVPILDAPQAG